MIKIIITSLLLVTILFSKSYNFTEIRYSDAIDKSIHLDGIISFDDESLEILYEKSDKRLVYEDEEMSMHMGDEEISLETSEVIKIAQYFEIIILLYEGDNNKLQENFTIKTEGETTLLFPKDEMNNYIGKIKLVHEKENLKSLKLYLTNDDTIKISIEDEVH